MGKLRIRFVERWLVWLSVLAVSAGCAAGGAPTGGGSALTASVTLVATPVLTAAPAATPLPPAPSATPAATATSTATATPTASATPTSSATPTASAMPTASATPEPSATPTPGPTPDGIARQLRVPILMYHYVSQPPSGADIYRRDLSVTPARLEEHLAYLQEAGYIVVTLDDLLYALTRGQPLPEKPVILTFDDGYEDNYINAFPLLKKRGMTATFFIVTDWVNASRAGYMTWPQIEEMAAAGQRFGSHSRDHPSLAGQSVDYLVWQALGSKEAIEEHLGYHPRWVAYPSGGYDARTIAVFASAHYWGGLTTQQGATHTLADIFELKRVRVRGTHTVEDLATLLELPW